MCRPLREGSCTSRRAPTPRTPLLSGRRCLQPRQARWRRVLPNSSPVSLSGRKGKHFQGRPRRSQRASGLDRTVAARRHRTIPVSAMVDPKRTSNCNSAISAFGSKADITAIERNFNLRLPQKLRQQSAGPHRASFRQIDNLKLEGAENFF